jgi:hypothetical protein
MTPRKEQDSEASKLYDSQHQSHQELASKNQSHYQTNESKSHSVQTEAQNEAGNKAIPPSIVTGSVLESVEILNVLSPNSNPFKEHQ